MASINNVVFSEIVALSSQSVLVVDASSPKLRIVYANTAYEEASGYSTEDLVGTPWLQYAAADEDSAEVSRLRRGATGREALSMSCPFLRRDGEIWLPRCRLSPLEGGSTIGRYVLVEHLVDSSAASDPVVLLTRALGGTQRISACVDRTDSLTGLLSPDEFRLMLRREIAIARRGNQSLHLMMFSIPEFAVYRSTFGNNAADSCLRMIGAQIAGTFRRASDLSARLDEAMFCVSVVGQDEAQVRRLVEQVESKARSLGLHNPRGRFGRYVIVHGAMAAIDPAADTVETAMARCSEALDQRCDPRSGSIVGIAG